MLRFSVALALTCVLAACSGPGYYLQAISGQWKLMHARQDIQGLLANPETSQELVTQLQSADRIKRFAEDRLGLPVNDSYSSYVEIEGPALVWNVVAAPEFSLQPKKWCFPVAGCVPYRGFFQQQKALKSAARLQAKGMDVYISPATAYSSLGWFDDPLLSTMFSRSDTRLAAHLFHELAHQRLYVKGDGAFNEGYASFVEVTAVKIWLESQHRQADLLQWQQLRDARLDFSELIGDAREKLKKLYYSETPESTKRDRKVEILTSLTHSYKQLSTAKWDGKSYYESWFKNPPNNARLALYSTYEGSNCAFQRLFNQADGDLEEFHRLAEQKAALKKAERKLWLNQPCATSAVSAKL